MNIQSVCYRPYNTSFGRQGGNAIREDFYDNNQLLFGVSKINEPVLLDILKECERFGQQKFPKQKVTVFFKVEKVPHRNAMNYNIALAINAPQAKKGIVRDNSIIPGASYQRGSDFFYDHTFQTQIKTKLDFAKSWEPMKKELEREIERLEKV